MFLTKDFGFPSSSNIGLVGSIFPFSIFSSSQILLTTSEGTPLYTEAGYSDTPTAPASCTVCTAPSIVRIVEAPSNSIEYSINMPTKLVSSKTVPPCPTHPYRILIFLSAPSEEESLGVEIPGIPPPNVV